MFEGMMNDKIRVVKKDGTRSEVLKALVTANGIYCCGADVDVAIEIGDTIERYLSNGAVEKSKVTDPGFSEKQDGFKAHYQMKVRNLGSKDTKSPSSVTYNLQGDHNRIVSDSTDNSINLDMRNSKELQLIEELKKLVSSSNLSDKEKEEATPLVKELEDQVHTRSDTKARISVILEKLKKIAPLAPLINIIINLFS